MLAWSSSPVHDVGLKGKDRQGQVVEGYIILLVEEPVELLYDVLKLMVPTPLEIVEVHGFVCTDDTMCLLEWLLGIHPIIFNVGRMDASVRVNVIPLVANCSMSVVVA